MTKKQRNHIIKYASRIDTALNKLVVSCVVAADNYNDQRIQDARCKGVLTNAKRKQQEQLIAALEQSRDALVQLRAGNVTLSKAIKKMIKLDLK